MAYIEEFSLRHFAGVDQTLHRTILLAKRTWNIKILKGDIVFNDKLSINLGNLEVEIKESSKALEILNSKIEKIEEFKLPLENSNRTLIKIKKIKSCPKKYPRKYSEIKKQKL